MDASAGSSPPHSQENPPEHGGDLGEAPAEEIGGEAADDFLFAEDTFPSLPDFPCLSSPSSSTFSSSSSSNSSCAYTNAAGGAGGGADGAAGERSGPVSAGEGFDALDDIDQLLDFASLSMPWDSEPTFPEVSMMLEDAMFPPPHPVGDGRREGKAVLEGTGGEEACMDAGAAGEDLPRFFMEWLTSNRENISAEDLRSIRLRRSTIEAAAARLGGGRQGTMQLLKLILTWVQNHHLQRKRPRDALEEAAGLHGHGHSQLSSPGANPGYEFPAGGQDMAAGGGTSWMPYQQPFTPPAYGGDAVYPGAAGQYPFHQSSSTSSVVVNSQPFSPPAVGDMHAAGGGNMAWTQQYVPFPGASTGSYPMPPVVPQPFSPGFGGQYSGAGHPMPPQLMAGVEASATKEARKKRMARQRRLSCLQQQRSQQLNLGQIQVPVLQQEPSARSTNSAPVTPSGGGWGFWPPGSQQQVQNPLSKSNSSRAPMQQAPRSPEAAAPPPAKPAPGARQDESPQRSTASDKRQGAKTDKNLRYLLQKVLKQSDVGSLGRIVLPKEAEVHLPELKTRDGISIPMEDIGTSRVWNMRYRFWPNNKSRMYLLENTGEFVRSNELQEGDFIVIYSDVKSGKYLIRGVKVRPAQEQQGNGSSAVGKHKHGYPGPEKAGGASDDGGADGAGKPDGGCKGRSPQGVRRARHQGAASMAVSI
ncbi:hypothetical protein GQ55_5G046200 [Panicum hallii var. hallii]|uniref:TF-B3 domain-containing protein n=1 Tax=Panicum hallii var. hallii TaxID=1504633 RepID=A0A2T7DCM6_9POAL|nr:hypothetical protein GQ55_5G046200 [Panicum hallii var. hallii]